MSPQSCPSNSMTMPPAHISFMIESSSCISLLKYHSDEFSSGKVEISSPSLDAVFSSFVKSRPSGCTGHFPGNKHPAGRTTVSGEESLLFLAEAFAVQISELIARPVATFQSGYCFLHLAAM